MKTRISSLVVALVLATAGIGAGSLPANAQISANIVIGHAPPPPRVEVVPGPRPGYVWAPGHWVWNGRAHVWRRGRWIAERRGQRYMPAQWMQTPRGWQYVPGHWQR